MDSTFEAQEIIQIRRNTYDPSKIAPVLRLIVANTLEHAILCVSPDADILWGCVKAVKLLRNEAGVLEGAYEASVGLAPKIVAEWIAKRGEGPLCGVPPLPALHSFDSTAATQNGGGRKRHVGISSPSSSFPCFPGFGGGLSFLSSPPRLTQQKNSLLDATPMVPKKRKVTKDPPSSSAVVAEAPADTNETTSSPAAQKGESVFSRQPDILESVGENETESEDEPHLARPALKVVARHDSALKEMVCTK